MKKTSIKWILLGLLVIAWMSGCVKDQSIIDQDSYAIATLREPPSGESTVIADLPPVRITVPEGASKETIKSELEKALKEAQKNEKDPVVKGAYHNAAKGLTDENYQAMAEELGELEGLAFNYFHVVTRKGETVIVVVKIQILNPPPPNGGQALLEAHENGHSLIGAEVAKRCTSKAAEEAKEAGLKGNKSCEYIANKLTELETAAQQAYEQKTNHGLNGTPEDQGVWAQEEVDKVIEAYLAS